MKITFRRPASLLPGSTGKRATTRQFLGQFAKPGVKLGDKTFKLSAGDSVVFRVTGNQLRGIKLSPAKGVEVAEKEIKPHVVEWTITVPANAKSGKEVKLTSVPSTQASTDPAWAFNFKIKVP